MFNQISILRHHIYKATDYGADFHELCKRMKLSPEQLTDGEAHLQWVPGEDTDFWTHAVELTGDPCLGLHLGQRHDNYNAFGMLGLLASSCKNLGEALKMLCKYNDTLTGVFTYKLEVTSLHARFSFDPLAVWEETNQGSARQAVDMFAASLLRSLQDACVRKIHPIQIELRYSLVYQAEYNRILKSTVLFNQSSNCIVFDKEDLNVSLINYDQSLFSAFENLVQKKQSEMTAQQTLATKVRHLLLSSFHGQITHIDIIASTLCMTTRTLQRKLTEENTSYREICNSLRKELAYDLIKSTKSNKKQVAAMLGYSDIAAFNKAFRQWGNTV
jgi:AraC-like DNA-binding protein